MNCHYCQQETKEIATTTETKQVIVTKFITFMCGTCTVTYDYVQTDVEEPVLTTITFFNLQIKEREFGVKYNLISKQTEVCYYAKQTALPSIDAYEQFSVHTFPFLVDWTPQNALHKLKTYLPFL